MLHKMISSLAAAGILLSSITTACQLSNNGAWTGVETDTNLCMSQGEGQWTFGMSVGLVDVPAPGGSTASGAAQSTQFYIFDNACNIMSSYTPSGTCGVPWIIEENFLADVLTITRVEMSVGNPFFQFDYGDGEYSINNNGCVCNDESSGFEAAVGCRCAFPVDGHFTG